METDAGVATRPGVERWFVGALLGASFGAALFVECVGLGTGTLLALAASIAFTAVATYRFPPFLPASLDGFFSRRRPLAVAWAIVATLSLVELVKLAFFMTHPSESWASAQSSPFMTHHSCFTAYSEAARFASERVPNVYAPPLYRPDPQTPRMLDGFQVDPYMYPPTFLLLPTLLRFIAADFFSQRLIWYAFDFACVAGAMLALARWIGGEKGLFVALLVPIVLLSVPVRMSLQMGNFQLPAAAMCILAMIAFERRRPIGGAALLAFAVGAKLYPALLLVYLFTRRKYREVSLTIGFLVLYAGLVAALLGPQVVGVFFGFEAPRLATGKAFGMLHFLPWTVTINESIYGLVLKLGLLGLPHASFPAAGIVAWIYTLVAIAIAVALGKRQPTDSLATATTWVGLLAVASLRAPFLPQEYGLFLPIWLLSLVVARISTTDEAKPILIAIAAWAGLNILWPLEQFDRGVLIALLVAGIGQTISWVLIARTIARELKSPRASA